MQLTSNEKQAIRSILGWPRHGAWKIPELTNDIYTSLQPNDVWLELQEVLVVLASAPINCAVTFGRFIEVHWPGDQWASVENRKSYQVASEIESAVKALQMMLE